MSNRTCQTEGCLKDVKGHGWCSMHYQRWVKNGSAEPVQRPSVADRFWAKVDHSSGEGCWLWTGSFSNNGYGSFFTGREGGKSKFVRAHRFAYEVSVGEIPEGLVVDHLCRNRGCVNPSHLEPVTTRENLVRGEGFVGKQGRRTHCLRGGHPLSGSNLYVCPRGFRGCLECRAEQNRKTTERRRMERAALRAQP